MTANANDLLPPDAYTSYSADRDRLRQKLSEGSTIVDRGSAGVYLLDPNGSEQRIDARSEQNTSIGDRYYSDLISE
jgi:hypothetical protein